MRSPLGKWDGNTVQLSEKRKCFNYVLYHARLEKSEELWNYQSKYCWVEVGFAETHS